MDDIEAMAHSKGKFLLVVNNLETFWTHRVSLAKAIMDDGWTLYLATSRASADQRLKDLNIIPCDLPSYTASLNPFLQVKTLMKIIRVMREVKPDLIHAITVRYSFWTGLALRLTGNNAPAVFTVAGLGSLFNSQKAQVRAVRMAIAPLFSFVFHGKNRHVIFQNPEDAAALVKIRALDTQRYTLIKGSGVDTQEFSYMLEPLNEAPVVLFCSRLLKAKGIFEFIHAARILRSKGLPGRFQVAGEAPAGNHDSITSENINTWKKEGIVEFLGKRSDIPQVMRQSAIVTLPSYYGEGVPKVLLEAASTGRAIVTTDMPGCRETVEDGVTGILIEPKNAWALADALEKLLKDKALREEMGKRGRARIEKDFTIETVNAKTLAVYKKLMAPKGH